jgi:hypothetical protein
MSRPRGENQEKARYNLVEILDRRYKGEACKDIAASFDVPEHVIWQVCQETGMDLPKARPKHRKRPDRYKPTFLDIMNELSKYVDSIVFERSADDEGWICYIDDVPGEQCLVVDNALKSAVGNYVHRGARAS